MTLREKHQQGQFTITVELDPPKSSSAEKTFEQAARLKGKVIRKIRNKFSWKVHLG